VVEAAGEVVEDELLGGAELAAGLGNNQRRLPPVGCSRRKMTAGELRCPASLTGAVGRFSAQEGCGDGVPILVRSDNSEVAQCRLVTTGEAMVGAE
jgi:hypothetical protein